MTLSLDLNVPRETIDSDVGPWCRRCRGSGFGTVCIPSRDALIAATGDSAAAIEAALIAELASLPTDQARQMRIDGFRKWHSAGWILTLRRRVFKAMVQGERT
jgi:hypothetical protein